ncbi:AraC family transcriptional regulator [Anopheles sinensis]|uniref:AraC family transcriptional regulator n=1 Tax=Anopheles sinensis TaxID=74873 RepID=A0A084V9U5_ANOSI|nr:AraC family transcriptional regulator [Anopheles sinensis]
MGSEGSDVSDPMGSLDFLVEDISRFCEWPIAGPRDPLPVGPGVTDPILSSYFYADNAEDLVQRPAAASTGDSPNPEPFDQNLCDGENETLYGENQHLVDFDLLEGASTVLSPSWTQPQFFPLPDQIISNVEQDPSAQSSIFDMEADTPIQTDEMEVEPETEATNFAPDFVLYIFTYFYTMFQRAVASVSRQFR